MNVQMKEKIEAATAICEKAGIDYQTAEEYIMISGEYKRHWQSIRIMTAQNIANWIIAREGDRNADK